MKIKVHYPEDTLAGDLEKYNLVVEYSEADDREPIDFEIRNEKDELCATVWGSEPFKDVQIDCEHDFVEYSDDDNEMGVCPLCGAKCFWHWDIAYDGTAIIRERVIDGWDKSDGIGGIVGKELNRLKEKW